MTDPETIAVGVSGGVDSAVALALLREGGQRVFAITARLTAEYSRCCADEDIARAAAMARRLGVEHHVVDVCRPFQDHVIDAFMREYLAGRTPSPCVVCNRRIKFGVLWDKAAEWGATRLATGHYARRIPGPDGVGLARGRDPEKDQSYFLARLTPVQLARSVFPLGAMTKSEVRQVAAERNIEARASRESQDICFVTEGTHGEYIDLRSFETRGAGPILDCAGRRLGRHRGIHHYTVGQRKGLGIATGTPLYVVAIDVAHNAVIVGARAETMRDRMRVEQASWIGGAPPARSFAATCQVRYRHAAAACHVDVRPDGSLDVRLEQPEFAITPGQLAAFYRGDRVLGGGWIR